MAPASTGTVDIPVVDFAPFLDTSAPPADRTVVQDRVFNALSRQGFMYLKGHGIPQDVIDAAFRMSDRFFRCDADHKSKWDYTPTTNTGYVGLSRERLNPHLPQNDTKEAFNINPKALVSSDQAQLNTLLPPELSQDADQLKQFCLSVHGLLLKILESLSLSLRIPESFGGASYIPSRHPFTAPSGSIVRLLFYPPTLPTADSTIRAGAHTDYGSLTALFIRDGDPGGLQILPPDSTDTWIDAKAIPGTVIINAGDLMQFWTRGLVKSTVHRVVSVPCDSARLSLAYFMHPDDETLLDPIPSDGVGVPVTSDFEGGRGGEGSVFAGPESGGLGGRSITAKEHLMERLKKSYG
ncbi:hypothetical protein BC829DRAFT_277195 [Chytridium lagenaria]|nr:hypothetical protein BC829DRAFT_277195 [Chytridium lagenaria]